jgi:hypothetical protein
VLNRQSLRELPAVDDVGLCKKGSAVTIQIERIQEPDGAISFRISMPAEKAEAFASLIKAAFRLANPWTWAARHGLTPTGNEN